MKRYMDRLLVGAIIGAAATALFATFVVGFGVSTIPGVVVILFVGTVAGVSCVVGGGRS